MKTRFDISREVWGRDETRQEGIDYFNRFLSDIGFVINGFDGSVTKVYLKEFNINVGDHVCINVLGRRRVLARYINIDDDEITYVLEEE